MALRFVQDFDRLIPLITALQGEALKRVGLGCEYKPSSHQLFNSILQVLTSVHS